MTTQNLKTALIFIILVIASFTTSAQKKKTSNLSHTGYVVRTDGSTIRFTYSVSYKKEDEFTFVTTYKLFFNRDHQYDIVAKHINFAKKVSVEVLQAGGGIFASENTETENYETPSLKPFGFRGAYGVLAGDRIPNQMWVKFKDNSFTYIKVLHILGYHLGNGDADFYVLN